ncbi:unnamed protein product [Zymoseptoria tritici ST99CH_1A5]|uniref:Uncharacterized protein n=2 Tax=Zymoseptoria tritici TaxID=1047171 RepID=A0A2H1H9L9_ZYMTR|nr:unnamed protein product [Zymoseptoria tritici ST99CH_1E4]SMR64996.1 unnamed protein product [Zymoseptoria tritici ST99CH_3D1]SMY30401.1 unnamed protein product [Zymoseptoria tritici ST99CH_1A5]
MLQIGPDHQSSSSGTSFCGLLTNLPRRRQPDHLVGSHCIRTIRCCCVSFCCLERAIQAADGSLAEERKATEHDRGDAKQQRLAEERKATEHDRGDAKQQRLAESRDTMSIVVPPRTHPKRHSNHITNPSCAT